MSCISLHTRRSIVFSSPLPRHSCSRLSVDSSAAGHSSHAGLSIGDGVICPGRDHLCPPVLDGAPAGDRARNKRIVEYLCHVGSRIPHSDALLCRGRKRAVQEQPRPSSGAAPPARRNRLPTKLRSTRYPSETVVGPGRRPLRLRGFVPMEMTVVALERGASGAGEPLGVIQVSNRERERSDRYHRRTTPNRRPLPVLPDIPPRSRWSRLRPGCSGSAETRPDFSARRPHGISWCVTSGDRSCR